MKSKWSKTWLRSKQTRKQRKYLHNLPLHLAKSRIRSTLNKDLRKKYNTRTVGLRKGDKIKIMRGDNKGKTGKVTRISLIRKVVYIEGIEYVKKDGNKIPKKLKASDLMIIELDLGDKKRKAKLEKK